MSCKSLVLLCAAFLAVLNAQGACIDLSGASVDLAVAKPDNVTRTAARVLSEEVAKRTGLDWSAPPEGSAAGASVVLRLDPALPPESYAITAADTGVTLTGADGRGLLYAVGRFLAHHGVGTGRSALSRRGCGRIRARLSHAGHQLGYRFQSNSYDTWDDAQYEQYIRELAMFGCNSIENIPFEDDRKSPHMPLDRRSMNRRISEICLEYGLDYWIWTPAVFDLSDKEKRAAHLAEHKQLYKDCPELTGVFFPGGDPGANPPELVLPFIEELAGLCAVTIRRQDLAVAAMVQRETVRRYLRLIDREKPDWFGGLRGGPGSPPAPETRAPDRRLPGPALRTSPTRSAVNIPCRGGTPPSPDARTGIRINPQTLFLCVHSQLFRPVYHGLHHLLRRYP